MIELKGDLFAQECDAICITTNGYVKTNGEAVMGRGVAKQAALRWPMLPASLGASLVLRGNVVQIMHVSPWDGDPPYKIVSFPVKPEYVYFTGKNVVRHMQSKYRINDKVPGFAAVACPNLIFRSAQELKKLADEKGWTKVVLPRPGCGAGELSWEDIKPMLADCLDDRFIVVNNEA